MFVVENDIDSEGENNINFNREVTKVENLSDLIMFCNVNSSTDKSNFQTNPEILNNELISLQLTINNEIQRKINQMQSEIEIIMKSEMKNFDGIIDKNFIQNIEVKMKDLEIKMKKLMDISQYNNDSVNENEDDNDRDNDKNYNDNNNFNKENSSINYFDHINELSKLDDNDSDNLFRMMTIISQIIISNNSEGISLDAAKPYVDWITRKKMKISMKASWSRFQYENRNCRNCSSIEILLKFLKKKFEIAEKMAKECFNEIDDKEDDLNDNIYLEKCTFCYHNHSITHCPDIINRNWNQGRVIVKMKKLCLNCLKTGHIAMDCLECRCSICNQLHSNLLHQYIVPNSSSPKIYDLTRNFSHSGTINAEVEHKGRKIKVKFLIDSGSEVTVISEHV